MSPEHQSLNVSVLCVATAMMPHILNQIWFVRHASVVTLLRIMISSFVMVTTVRLLDITKNAVFRQSRLHRSPCVSVWSGVALQFALQDLKIAPANASSVHLLFGLHCTVYYKRAHVCQTGGRRAHAPQGRA